MFIFSFLAKILTAKFGLSGALGSALSVLIVAGVLAAGLWGAVLYFERQGFQKAIEDINNRDKEAGDAADEARTDFNSCIDAGGVFDFATGKCDRQR